MRVVNSFSELLNSDSYRKTPITGMTGASSDKSGKCAANKEIRSGARQWGQDYADALNSMDERHAETLMTAKEPSTRSGNPYRWPKDGKQFLTPPEDGDTEAAQMHAKLLRK